VTGVCLQVQDEKTQHRKGWRAGQETWPQLVSGSDSTGHYKDFVFTSVKQTAMAGSCHFFFSFFLVGWNLNSGLHACKAGILLLEPHIQFLIWNILKELSWLLCSE
jgi:hypothetical protein